MSVPQVARCECVARGPKSSDSFGFAQGLGAVDAADRDRFRAPVAADFQHDFALDVGTPQRLVERFEGAHRSAVDADDATELVVPRSIPMILPIAVSPKKLI